MANTDLTTTTLKVGRLFALMMPILILILNLSMVAIMWFGGIQVADHGMPIGDLTAFLTYIVQILLAVLMATIMFVMVPRAPSRRGASRRCWRRSRSSWTRRRRSSPTAEAGLVEFRDVEFRYPGAEEPVLSGISFTARPGETTAIVGSTGSGKTTLISLIPRFYDVTGGAVLLDGVDVREMAQQDVWRRIGLVPQKAFLFSGTVADNLRYGDEQATDEGLWHQLEVAQGREFVEEMPGSAGGARLAGRRQRLRRAAAAARHRPGARQASEDTDLRRQLLRAGLHHRRALARGAAQAHGRCHRDHRRAARGYDHARRPDHRPRGRHDRRHRHARGTAQTSETYREIVASQLGEESVA